LRTTPSKRKDLSQNFKSLEPNMISVPRLQLNSKKKTTHNFASWHHQPCAFSETRLFDTTYDTSKFATL
jgi:hypothetical protein